MGSEWCFVLTKAGLCADQPKKRFDCPYMADLAWLNLDWQVGQKNGLEYRVPVPWPTLLFVVVRDVTTFSTF